MTDNPPEIWRKILLHAIRSYLHTLCLYPFARLIVFVQSERQRFRTRSQSPVIHINTKYDGRKILLLALYQKGELRPDVIRLLQVARDEGLYVLAINTLRLQAPTALAGLVDCYIERPNFGRDFGSYQTGFQHIFGQGWQEACQRLLMINDSVFFSHGNLRKFLTDMMTSEVEVLGSTENFDIEHHLGSFCIAFSGSILRAPAFERYWQRYRTTDVRPRVIKTGEIRLSKVAKRCASSSAQFASLYSASQYVDLILRDDEMITYSLRNRRASKIFAWKQASIQAVAEEYQKRVGIKVESDSVPVKAGKLELPGGNYKAKEIPEYVTNFNELFEYFQKRFGREDIDGSILRDILVNELAESFLAGSQIHQNSGILLKLGLPIIKLDGLYRGIFSVEDMIRLVNMLEPAEGRELQDLLVTRPYGGRYLTGWRRAAFNAGLL